MEAAEGGARLNEVNFGEHIFKDYTFPQVCLLCLFLAISVCFADAMRGALSCVVAATVLMLCLSTLGC